MKWSNYGRTGTLRAGQTYRTKEHELTSRTGLSSSEKYNRQVHVGTPHKPSSRIRTDRFEDGMVEHTNRTRTEAAKIYEKSHLI